jgi:flagellar hook-associated protein 1 FlgK
MSDLLSIGASGVRAYGTALAAIGNNVSNADTAGYTRRTVTLTENTSSDGVSSLSAGSGQFGGVSTTDVGRAWNDYQAAAARSANSDAGAADAKATWLSDAETALDDGATGVGQSATAIFTAGDTLAADPGSTSSRNAFLSQIGQTTSALNTTAAALAQTSSGIASAAQSSVQTVNADLDQLDKINTALNSQPTGTTASADLLDQRDSLLDDISGNVGISVTLSGTGAATVTLANSNVQLTGGINGSGTGARLTLTSGANGTLAVQAVSVGKAQAVGDTGGTLGGLVSSAQTVADRRTSLDKMAADFATALNAWNAAGTTAAGAAGGALVTGTTAATIAVATSDPAAIAAASSTASNGNLLNLSTLRSSTGIEQSWSGMVTDQGQVVASANTAQTAADAVQTAAMSARDQSSGVDLDTEAAELLRYQQAYSGAAKVIQTAKDTMQSILDLF